MARASKMGTEQVFSSLIAVFRQHGFEGASLSLFSESSGLIKASLYHRFPGGKEEMALAALTEVDRVFATHVLAPVESDGDLKERLKLITERLNDFYEGGAQACLLETLSSAGTPESVRNHVKNTLSFWVDKFTKLCKESGVPAKEARVRAEGAIASIEGALVVSRAQQNNRAFKRSLESLPGRLLG
jgi:AcrR family transcriptional regulator